MMIGYNGLLSNTRKEDQRRKLCLIGEVLKNSRKNQKFEK
jgi:hypothetical protein